VSHQLDRIAELCSKAILLDKGTIRASGAPVYCINTYLNLIDETAATPSDGVIRFERIFAPDGAVVDSGGRLTLVVSGHADAANAPSSWSPALRIVERENPAGIYFVTGEQRGVPLPVSGQFEYQLSLQMNVPAGRYTAYPVVWDSAGHRDVTIGPSIHVDVLEGKAFHGTVQMNLEWRVIQGAAYPASAQARRA
jgi:hypothetical protein